MNDRLLKLALEQIKSDLDAVYQWGAQINKKAVNVDYSSTAFQYMHRAEALIALLEVYDCGSFGGFDDGEKGLYSLEERFKFLKNKRRKS